MSYEQRDNGGILFKNDKEGVEARPDYQGMAMIGNKPFYISAWVKQGKKGKFMSLSFKPKLLSDRVSTPTGGKNDPRPSQEDEWDSEIPF